MLGGKVMLPEELAREKIDKQLKNAGWDIVDRNDYSPMNAQAVKEALMQRNKESDYLLFVDDKAIAVIEAKKEDNNLDYKVAEQAENYAYNPKGWYGLWTDSIIPLVYLANGNKIYFKNLLTNPDGDYIEISEMHSPKRMLRLINKTSEFGALPRLNKQGLRDCQYEAEINFEKSLKEGKRKSLAMLATGAGKTYLACLATYRLLNYTKTNRVLFLADRNNLARQAETEFCLFDRTEKNQTMNSLYRINRLKKKEDIDADIVISTIQKLFSVLTGQKIIDDDEDKEDESTFRFANSLFNNEIVNLGNDLKLPSDYFQFIIIDECHRSIYGKWKSVLDYFKGAIVLGLTATPTPEAYAFFNSNIIEQYTYENSIVDGVNVPARVFRIKTNITEHGGLILDGDHVTELNKAGLVVGSYVSDVRVDYASTELDKSVINPHQMNIIIREYRDAVFSQLYPTREENWHYIPKTLIFAKNDNHASEIVEIIKDVFKEKFKDNKVPDGFVQKITYSAGDSNALIRDFRNEKNFRIAVTVTLVATGTDVKPLEVVMFMNDIKSEVLYTQMKGRGCRFINDDKLREVTPNADTKECFYIVDAIGVTEHDKSIPKPNSGKRGPNTLSLEQLLERLAHGEVNNDNLSLLRDYCSTIQKRYENNPLFQRHLDSFISSFNFAPKTLANSINEAISNGSLPLYLGISNPNIERKNLISCLISNVDARKKIIEMHKGYYIIAPDEDKIIYSGFSKESAKAFIQTFEEFLANNTQKIEALQVVYNSEDKVITHSMLTELKDELVSENRQYTSYNIWNNYKILDKNGVVDDYDTKHNPNAVTNLLQIVRYAFRKTNRLSSLYGNFARRFNLYCGQAQRELSQEQKNIMRSISEYIVSEGAINPIELNEFDPDLWRKATKSFKAELPAEMITLSNFILRTV